MAEEKNKPEQTLEELERELAEKKRLIESPFAAVGLIERKPRGRPPKGIATHNSSDEAKAAAAIANEQRLAEIPVPASDLSPEGMREYGEKELHKLIPEAVARYSWNLKYGDERASTDIADKIFKATGIAQKEVSNFGKGGSIVINLGAGASGLNLPFMNNSKPTVPVIATLEGELIKKKEEE